MQDMHVMQDMQGILTWNINGLVAAVRRERAFGKILASCDVVCLQETRCGSEATLPLLARAIPERTFPHRYFCSSDAKKKGYAGVAVVSRVPALSCEAGLSNGTPAAFAGEGRVLTLEFGAYVLVCVYVPNSGANLERLHDRLAWDRAFAEHIKGVARSRKRKPVIVCGDLNVAEADEDVYAPERLARMRVPGFTEEERRSYRATLLHPSLGLSDAWRTANKNKKPEQQYTYYSARIGARAKGHGWRIDTFLVTPGVEVGSCDILGDVEGSDHVPVLLSFSFSFTRRMTGAGEGMPFGGTCRAGRQELAAALLAKQLEDHESPYGALAYERVRLQVEAGRELGDLQGVGNKISALIRAVCASGDRSSGVPSPEAMAEARQVARLIEIPFVGVKGALRIVRRQDGPSTNSLTRVQRACLAHMTDIVERIPRSEMELHERTIKGLLKGLRLRPVVAGSYRRGAAASGDVDVVLMDGAGRMADAVEALTASGYVIEALSSGPQKFMGICRLPGQKARRIDLVAPRSAEEAPFALLYMTGPAELSVEMRKRARQLGLSLSEHGLVSLDASPSMLVNNERSVFKALGMPYVPPRRRS